MSTIKMLVRGVAAGLLATCVLSVLILIKQWLPQLDTITVMDSIAHEFALSAGLPTPFAGWLWHFIIGSLVWGWMYAVMEPILPGRRPMTKGLYYGAMVTLLVWFAVLPLVGAGMFGLQLSMIQPLVSMAQSLLFGLLLAVTYDWLSQPRPGG
ncbi:MAG: hypothetical protein HKP57_06200 [Halobacteria archaeon]|nr:hypothetical protein [Halobacteria archaeon]